MLYALGPGIFISKKFLDWVLFWRHQNTRIKFDGAGSVAMDFPRGGHAVKSDPPRRSHAVSLDPQ